MQNCMESRAAGTMVLSLSCFLLGDVDAETNEGPVPYSPQHSVLFRVLPESLRGFFFFLVQKAVCLVLTTESMWHLSQAINQVSSQNQLPGRRRPLPGGQDLNKYYQPHCAADRFSWLLRVPVQQFGRHVCIYLQAASGGPSQEQSTGSRLQSRAVPHHGHGRCLRAVLFRALWLPPRWVTPRVLQKLCACQSWLSLAEHGGDHQRETPLQSACKGCLSTSILNGLLLCWVSVGFCAPNTFLTLSALLHCLHLLHSCIEWINAWNKAITRWSDLQELVREILSWPKQALCRNLAAFLQCFCC